MNIGLILAPPVTAQQLSMSIPQIWPQHTRFPSVPEASVTGRFNRPEGKIPERILGVRRFSLLAASAIELNPFGETTPQVMRITFGSAPAGASRT